MKQTKVEWKAIFDSGAFAAAYHTDLPLGAFPEQEHTRFRLWSPTAQGVTLRLYDRGEGKGLQGVFPLNQGEGGNWSLTLPGNLDGLYYDYAISYPGETWETPDPYARAAGRNGLRSMVVDLSTTHPEGWDQDAPPPLERESVIYETHVKDFTFDPASGVAPQLRGKYLGFCQEGTTLHGDGVHPTGLDYLKTLGVTHIQLMPVYDFGSVDEGGPEGQFNWGYDPENYNLPEGSYSTDPAEGKTRIRELKTLIQALHRGGFRVIMDVVYNHTYRLDAPLFRTAPWYYVRQNEDGTPSNGSYCGCDLASERSMCARYILESVLYWAEEYHMDGFRFDLMGLLDVPLMNEIRAQLDRRFGPGEKLLFGEPWAAGPTACRPGTLLADKGGLHSLKGVGAFCDATRDGVKGDLEDPAHPGLASGGGLDPDLLARCLRGWVGDHPAFGVNSPAQTITYLSSHDDWTLWDKLVYTLDPARDFTGTHPAVLRANRLAAAVNFCCQGYPFLLAGEEFGRTKLGVRDSFQSPPELNRMDWSLAWARQSLADYYRGLIALRKQCPALWDKSERAGDRFGPVELAGPDCAVVLADNRGESPWSRLFLCFNCGGEAVEVALPEGDWTVLADGENSFLWRKNHPLHQRTVVIPADSALILGQ